MENLKEFQLSDILEYLTKEHEKYIDDYIGTCSYVAMSIAKMLFKHGKKPELLIIEGSNNDALSIDDNLVEPKMYDGMVQWGEHIVCACDGFIYDPMVGKPMKIEEYVSTVFINPVSVKVESSYEDIEHLLK